MKKKTVLLTGAGSGLGKEAALTLAKRGHYVIATVLFEEEKIELEEIAKKQGLHLISFVLDIRKQEDREKIYSYSFDVFFANAAIGESGSVSEAPIEKIREVFETNIFANITLVQMVIKNMVEKKKEGRIVFLASLAGRIPMPFLSPYCASKASIEIFATCLRQEMKLLEQNHIEIAIIEPGAYATGFNKENNEKMYEWMGQSSYFYSIIDKIKQVQEKVWNFIEIKPFDSIIKKYVKVVETTKLRPRYSAPWYQVFLIQLGRIIGM